MKKIYILLPLVVALTSVVHAVEMSSSLCQMLIEYNHDGFTGLENQILDSTRLHDINQEKLSSHLGEHLLSVNGVYRIPMTNGYDFVLRLNSAGVRASFEQFVSLFFENLQGVAIPAIRKLDSSQLEFLINRLQKAYYTITPERTKNALADPHSNATMALFYPPATGQATLNAIYGFQVREFLVDNEFFQIYRGKHNKSIYNQRIAKNITSQTVRFLNEDLKKVTGKEFDLTVKDITLRTQNLITAAWIMQQKANKYDLLVLGWYRLPKEIRTQLADHWAVFTAIGLNDFHPGNWLYAYGNISKNRSVIAIDGSDRTSFEYFQHHPIFNTFKSIESLPNSTNTVYRYWFHSPIYNNSIIEPLLNAVVADISPAIMSDLTRITYDKIASLAQRAQENLMASEVQAILNRIHDLNDLRSKLLRK